MSQLQKSLLFLLQPPFPKSLPPDGGKGSRCATEVSCPLGGKDARRAGRGLRKKRDFCNYLPMFFYLSTKISELPLPVKIKSFFHPRSLHSHLEIPILLDYIFSFFASLRLCERGRAP